MTKSKSNFFFGAIVLVVSNLITKIIGAVYRVPLLKTLGSEGLGEYQMILPIYALFLVIASSGIVVTMSKFISKEIAANNKHNAKKYLKAGIVISLAVSTLLSLLLIFISPTLSKYQSSNGMLMSYVAIVPAIIIGSVVNVFRGYFLGKKRMYYSGATQVVEALCKLIFSLFLSAKFAKFGFAAAVTGALLGISVSEVFGLIFVIVIYNFSKKHKFTYHGKLCKKDKFLNISKNGFVREFHVECRYINFWQACKKVFSFSFFVMLQACIMPLIGAVDSLLIVPLLLKSGIIQPIAYSLFGLENGVVSSILALPTVVAVAVGSAIIPSIKNKSQNSEITSNNVKNAFKIVWISSIFCAFVFVLFSKDITIFLYGNGLGSKMVDELSVSSDLLKINAFNVVYLCLLSLSTSVLQGLEKNKVPVIHLGFAAICRLLALILFLSNDKINIYGTAIADMIFYSIALILNIRIIQKECQIKFSFAKFFVFPLLSSIAMCLGMEFMKVLLSDLLSGRVLTILIMLTGTCLYVLLLCITKVINLKEIGGMFLKKKQRAQ